MNVWYVCANHPFIIICMSVGDILCKVNGSGTITYHSQKLMNPSEERERVNNQLPE